MVPGKVINNNFVNPRVWMVCKAQLFKVKYEAELKYIFQRGSGEGGRINTLDANHVTFYYLTILLPKVKIFEFAPT